MNVELKITGRVESLHLEPGDHLVVTIDERTRVTADIASQIRDQLQTQFPDHGIIVLSPGLSLARAPA